MVTYLMKLDDDVVPVRVSMIEPSSDLGISKAQLKWVDEHHPRVYCATCIYFQAILLSRLKALVLKGWSKFST